MTLVAALLILLRSATKITHKAQAVTCLAAKWHVSATLDSFEAVDNEIHLAQVASPDASGTGAVGDQSDGTTDESEGEEDDLDNTKFIPAYAYSSISFQKRQALGKSTGTLQFYQLVP